MPYLYVVKVATVAEHVKITFCIVSLGQEEPLQDLQIFNGSSGLAPIYYLLLQINLDDEINAKSSSIDVVHRSF